MITDAEVAYPHAPRVSEKKNIEQKSTAISSRAMLRSADAPVWRERRLKLNAPSLLSPNGVPTDGRLAEKIIGGRPASHFFLQTSTANPAFTRSAATKSGHCRSCSGNSRTQSMFSPPSRRGGSFAHDQKYLGGTTEFFT